MSEAKLILPIQVGRKYVRRDGQVITAQPPSLFANDSPAAHVGVVGEDAYERRNVWLENGHSSRSGATKYPHDIVADFVEPPAWVPAIERLPESGTPVLLDIGKPFPLRAMWVAKHTLEVGLDGPEDWGDYDEEADTYYCPEGWYEWNEHDETHWRVSAESIAWTPLPLPVRPGD